MTTAPVRTIRSLGAMNAEPPERLTIDAMIKNATNELALAEPYLRHAGMWLTTSDAPNEYRTLLDALVMDVQMTKAGTRLTNEAKSADIDALVRVWRPSAEAIVERLETQAAKWERELTAAARPPAPVTDPVLLEAQLANARSDARMTLERSSGLEIAARLAEMARGDDPALAYLMLASTWPATYLRSLGDNSITALWEQERAEALAAVLTEKALQAHERLAGIPHARRAAQGLRMGHSFFIKDNPELFEAAGA